MSTTPTVPSAIAGNVSEVRADITRLQRASADHTRKAEALVAAAEKAGRNPLRDADVFPAIDEQYSKASTLKAEAEVLQSRLVAIISDGTTAAAPTGSDAYSLIVDGRFQLPTFQQARHLAQQSTTPDASGGFVTPDGYWPQVIDELRPASVVLAAMPAMFPTANTQLEIPKVGASVTAAWTAENASIGESQVTFSQLLLTPKKLAALTLASNEVANDSNPAMRAVLTQNHTREMGEVLDDGLLNGTGAANDPIGLFALGDKTGKIAVGGALTLDVIKAGIGDVEALNATPSAIFMSPANWTAIRLEQDTQNRYQMTPDPAVTARRQIDGVDVYVSSQIADSEALVADMSSVAVASRDRLTLAYSSDYAFGNDQIAVRSTSRWDIGLLHDDALLLLEGIA